MRLLDGFRRLPFRLKMGTAMAALFIVLACFIAAFALHYFHKLHLETIGRQNYSLAKGFALMLDNKLRIAQESLVIASRNAPANLLSDRGAAYRFLDRHSDLSIMFDGGVYLIGRDGIVFAGRPAASGHRGRSVANLEFFQVTTRSRSPYISKPHYAFGEQDRPSVAICIPVFAPNGEMIGQLHGVFDLLGKNFLADVIEQKIGDTGYFSMITYDRVMVAHPVRERVMQPAAPPGQNLMVDRAIAGDFGYGETWTSHGRHLISAHHGLGMVPWILGAHMPYDEAQAPVRAALPYYVASAFMAAAVTLIIANYLVRRFTRPLEAMTAQAVAMSAHPQMDVQLTVKAFGEVGDLAEAFNRLLAKINEQQGELIESEVRFHKIFHESPLITIISDAETGRYIAVNRAFEAATGLPQEDVIGKTPEECGFYFDPDIWRIFKECGVLDGVPCSAKRSSGDHHYILYARRLDIGGVSYVLGILRDVTEVRSVEREKDKLRTMLVHSQKMESMGILAGGVAHDFNNLLTGMMGHTHMALGALEHQRGMAGVETAFKNVEAIDELCDKASALTESLLAFSRRKELRVEAVDINEVVQRSEKLLARLVGENVVFSVQYRESVMACVDSLQIEQVIMNMAVNARDAMPQGGRLTIATGVEQVDTQIAMRHGVDHAGDYACITITDTGVGMDEETRGRIFDPFFTTKDIGKGTGLGLSIAFGIIQQHQGFISVYSEPRRGTSFRIYLPVCEQISPKSLGRAGADRMPAPGGSETILIAEDDATVRKVHRQILESVGYTVIEAKDGMLASEIYREHGNEIALVILDVMMPVMDGIKAYDLIHAMDSSATFLFITGYADDSIRRRGDVLEDAELLYKPVAGNMLLEKVREIIDRDAGGEAPRVGRP